MINIRVLEPIKEFGFVEGDLLFYNPELYMFEYSDSTSINEFGFQYTSKETMYVSPELLSPYVDNGSMQLYSINLED